MTPKQILDSFSATLMQDERILSAQERALLGTLLRHARDRSTESPEVQESVRGVFASAVGETVAQRAFAVLGGSIVDGILSQSAASALDLPESYAANKSKNAPMSTPGVPGSPGQPQGPGTPLKTPGVPSSPGQPQGPGVVLPSQPQQPGYHGPHKAPHHQPKHEPMRDTPVTPPKQPQGPGASTEHTIVASTAVLERPATLPARCVVLDEFLAPQELEELTRFTLEHEQEFRVSEVASPGAESGVVNYEHRRSRVLMDLERFERLILDRIKSVLPQVLQKLDMPEFDISSVEAQITASNDGDFFHFHNDNGSHPVASRYLTFVYFFHREPKQFEGGELRIHDARLERGEYESEGTYQKIVPRQNQIVFFPCEMMHEITRLECPSKLFADSRFTLNGWLRR